MGSELPGDYTIRLLMFYLGGALEVRYIQLLFLTSSQTKQDTLRRLGVFMTFILVSYRTLYL